MKRRYAIAGMVFCLLVAALIVAMDLVVLQLTNLRHRTSAKGQSQDRCDWSCPHQAGHEWPVELVPI
jgi:hypothetical protein